MNAAGATREVYWNITHVWVMYALLLPTALVAGFGLYRKVRLTTPVNEEILSQRGLNGFMDSDEVYASAGYMDPNAFTSNVYVKALYDYKANKNDEHSFSMGAVLTNVSKQDGGWWRGDLAGKKQHWFPDRKSTRLNSSHSDRSRMPSSA